MSQTQVRTRSAQVVRAALAPQVKALTDKRLILEEEIVKARVSADAAHQAEAVARNAAAGAWGRARSNIRVLDIVLGGFLPAALAASLIILESLALATLSAAPRIAIGAITAIAIGGGLRRTVGREAAAFRVLVGSLVVLSVVGLAWYAWILWVWIVALGAFARSRRPGLMGSLDAGVPDEGAFGMVKNQMMLYVPGTPQGLPIASLPTLEHQHSLVFRQNGHPALWCAPQAEQWGAVVERDWIAGSLLSFVKREPALVAWAVRDSGAAARAERFLQNRADELAQVAARLDALERQAQAWDGVGLPEETLRHLVTSASLVAGRDPGAPSGILLYGPSGTGKTEIGQRLAQAGGMSFIATSAPALKSEHVGGTEQKVADLFKQARTKTPCLIFVDECDSCLPDRGGSADTFAKSITESFLTQWQGFEGSSGVCVVGATNHRDRIDPAIMSRFSDAVEIGPPDLAARVIILDKAFKAAGLTVPVPDTLAAQTAGAVGRDLMTLAKTLRRQMLESGATELTADTISRSLGSLRGRGSTAVDASATWDTLVLPADVLVDLKTMTRMISMSEVLKAQGVRVPRGILLEGPPGTGKTQIARTMANMSGLSFIPLSPSELKGEYVGQTANKVKNALERARGQAPAIVFFDEIDTIAPARGGAGGDSFTQDLVGQLLQELDGAQRDERPIFFLAATNRVDTLDAAVRSRFPRVLQVPLPDRSGRVKLLEILLVTVQNVEGDRAQISAIMADLTEGYSGRDLRSLVEQATIQAFLRTQDATKVILSIEDLRSALTRRP